ncbi:hypothetical protein BH23PLA1_BH23PLA1_30660 [soil metagenome]
MTVVTVQLTESAKALIDTRLDTIDRMLLGRVPRADRLAIVKDVEAQIHEQLQERGEDELDREDVLAVFARLDPPEAYLPEEGESEPVATRITVAPRSPRYAGRGRASRLGTASGVVGICALVLGLFYPLVWPVALALGSELVLFAGWGVIGFFSFTCGVVGLILGICSRPKGAWAFTGMVTGGLAILFMGFACIAGIYLFSQM